MAPSFITVHGLSGGENEVAVEAKVRKGRW
jgi:hypothetical protein